MGGRHGVNIYGCWDRVLSPPPTHMQFFSFYSLLRNMSAVRAPDDTWKKRGVGREFIRWWWREEAGGQRKRCFLKCGAKH